jgi:hypothetical protein
MPYAICHMPYAICRTLLLSFYANLLCHMPYAIYPYLPIFLPVCSSDEEVLEMEVDMQAVSTAIAVNLNISTLNELVQV